MFTRFWPKFAAILPEFSQLGPGEMYADPGGYRLGPRSLHFRGRRPIPRLPKLASSCARPAAALRDILWILRRSGKNRNGGGVAAALAADIVFRDPEPRLAAVLHNS